MAKGDSVSADAELECLEVAGEYRRSVARCRDGLVAGTEDPDQAAPVGYRRS